MKEGDRIRTRSSLDTREITGTIIGAENISNSRPIEIVYVVKLDDPDSQPRAIWGKRGTQRYLALARGCIWRTPDEVIPL